MTYSNQRELLQKFSMQHISNLYYILSVAPRIWVSPRIAPTRPDPYSFVAMVTSKIGNFANTIANSYQLYNCEDLSFLFTHIIVINQYFIKLWLFIARKPDFSLSRGFVKNVDPCFFGSPIMKIQAKMLSLHCCIWRFQWNTYQTYIISYQ